MIRLRMPSIRYETGLIVATVRNQSISIRFRGRFIDERKRKTKKSGNSAWIASPEPVRSARKAPIAPKPSAIRTPRKTMAKTPSTPLSGADARDEPDGQVERRLDQRERDHAGELAEQERGAAHRRQREAVEEAGLDVAREVRAGVRRREERALHEREGEREVEVRVGRKPREARGRLRARRRSPRAGSAGRRTRGRRSAAGAACARPSGARGGRPERRSGLHAGRGLGLGVARPRRRRPRASGRSWRGRRRRASARAAGDAARWRPSASSARTTSASCLLAAVEADRRALGRARDRSRRSARAFGRRAPSSAGSAGIASTVGRPISALSAAGVPSATMWPWSMIPTRSARTSASSRYCVVRKTVTPSSRARRATSAQSALRLCGSRPVVGSSRKRMLRPVDEREREVEPALHPAGVGPHLAVGRLGQPDALEQLLAPRAPLRPAACRAAPSAGAGARGR